MLFRYIVRHYLKYFFIILTALIFFVVGIDYLEKSSELPDSANLLILYFIYIGFYALELLWPIALIFAMIATKIQLIRSNALVAFYALGYSKTAVLKPFVIASIAVIMGIIGLSNFDKYTNARDYAQRIIDSAQYSQPTRDLFFTYGNQYVYFGRLYPLEKRATDIRIFNIKDNALQRVIEADVAVYNDPYWQIEEATMIEKPKKIAFGEEGIIVEKQYDLKTLKDFRPRILDQVFEGKVSFTIGDALSALWFLGAQNINLDVVKSAFYKMIVYPFFVPAVIIIIFFFVPISSRFLNLSFFSFVAILSALLVWGMLFFLISLSNTKTIPSEVGIVLPVFVLGIAAMLKWRSQLSGVK